MHTIIKKEKLKKNKTKDGKRKFKNDCIEYMNSASYFKFFHI